MLLCDTSRPEAAQIALQRFRLARALEWVLPTFLNQAVDLFNYLWVIFVPPEVLFPCVVRPGHRYRFSLLFVLRFVVDHL